MNKEIKQVGLGMLGGVAVRGVGGIFPTTTNPRIVHGVLFLAAALGAWKIDNPDAKSALMGATVVKGLDLAKSVFETTPTAQTLAAKTDKMSAFLRSAAGLGCPADDNGLNAVMLGSDGKYYQYDESGLQGTFIDENGQVIQVDGLNAYADNDGLFASSDEDPVYGLLGVENELDVM